MTRRRVAIIFVALVGLLVVLASLLGNIADVVFELEAERSIRKQQLGKRVTARPCDA